MDAYDLFKKLGTGAKFDFKRFRKDAERLKLVRPKSENKLDTAVDLEDSHEQTQEDKSQGNRDEDDSSSESSESDSSTSSNTESESANQESDTEELHLLGEVSTNQESDTGELRILDDMTSKEDNYKQKERKQRKHKAKASTVDMKNEEMNHIRNVHRIHVYGTDIPEPCESFDKLSSDYKLHSRIIQNIQSVGYVTPTPIQIQAIPVMLHRRDLMACAPTGSGKTAAFILPILHQLKEPRNEGIRALVLAPTRELAKQTYREFQRLSEGLGFRLLYIDKIGKDTKKLSKASKKIDILVSTPNRLLYILKQFPPAISLSSVQWLVVDESDKLFEDGKSGFRDQLGAIYKACDGSNIRRAMFSATFAFDVEEWCKLNLDNVVQVYIGARNAATHTIEQSLLFVGSETGKLIAMRDIIRQGIQPPVLVFVQSKERAKELFHELIYDGMNVDVIHAERTQLQRDNVVKCFRSGKIWILICTELMGRGIDFKGVNLVINYDFPNSAISYIHRIGRTGRAGRAGKAMTFFTEDDAVNLRSIANVMRSAGCPVPDYMLKINKPSKKIRRKMAKSVPKRAQISTVTKYDRQKARQKRKMIEDQKRKHESLQNNDLSVNNTEQNTISTSSSGHVGGDRLKRKRKSVDGCAGDPQFKKKKFSETGRQGDKKFHKQKKPKSGQNRKGQFNTKHGWKKGVKKGNKKKKKVQKET